MPVMIPADGTAINFLQSEGLARGRLEAGNFPAFYRFMCKLRFPLPVADIWELRGFINNAADGFMSLAPTRDYREFTEALDQAIESYEISKPHHRERLRHILTLFRELHYRNCILSRNRENRIRHWLRDNRRARSLSLQYGYVMLMAGLLPAFMWLFQPDIHWLARLAAVLLPVLGIDFLTSLRTLDREHQVLVSELNRLLRERINEVDWKQLIYKLSLLLGYKHVEGVTVFHSLDSGDFSNMEH